MTRKPTYTREVYPLANGWQNFSWKTGTFDTGQRPLTERVEGKILLPHALVLVTLDGSARRLDVSSQCGHKYKGGEFAGAVSFVPAGCQRQLTMEDVRAKWASISLRNDLFRPDHFEGIGDFELEIPTFTNVQDRFISGLLHEFTKLLAWDGSLEPSYCDAMSFALAQHLAYRYGQISRSPAPGWKLTPWQIRSLSEYVEAHLDSQIQIAELAASIGLSAGYLHRAFRATTGKTPLEFINAKRIARARLLLAKENLPVAELALRVGFISPSHFARIFRRLTGVSPSQYRKH